MTIVSEVRPIDANAAALNTYKEIYWTESNAAAVRNFLAHQPTIDAKGLRPKRQCDWCEPGHERCGTCIKMLDYYGDGGSDKCSVQMGEKKCHYFKPMNYCPYCGAKMEV